MKAEDFKRVPKSHPRYSQRAYINKRGKVITRWQYQTLQNEGLDPRKKARINRENNVNPKRLHEIKQLSNLGKIYKERIALRKGTHPKNVKIRGSSESAKTFRALSNRLKQINAIAKKEWLKNGKSGLIGDYLDKSPTGELAAILRELGLRNPEWDMPVGES